MISVRPAPGIHVVACTNCARTLAAAVSPTRAANLADEQRAIHRCTAPSFDESAPIAGEYPLATIARLVGELRALPATWRSLAETKQIALAIATACDEVPAAVALAIVGERAA